jgi:pimeloyl-ACP methyl ester carboxylesterase
MESTLSINSRIGKEPLIRRSSRGSDRRFVGSIRARTSYLTVRSKPTTDEAILLIHGAGMSACSWTNQLRGLAPGLRVVAMDLPGHGASDAKPDAGLEDYADAASRLIDALGVGPVFVAGHSLGGAVALTLAARRPDQVKALILISTCAKLSKYSAAMDTLLGYVPQTLRSMVFFSTARSTLFSIGASNRAIQQGLKDLRSCPPETIRRDIAAAKAMDLEEVAQKVRVPTLILCGTADVLTPVATSHRLAALIPGSRIHLVNGAGHMLPLEAPERVDREILEFVESVVGTNLPRLAAAKPETRLTTVLRRILAAAGFARRSRHDKKARATAT